jgi:cytochrome bd-type quinol oxidase subunit 2
MNSYGAISNNNSLSNPSFVLKLSMVTFLIVQAIRQLVLVNSQATAKTESRAGQVATWMTITLTLIVAALLYPSGPLSRKSTLGGLFLVFAGVMGSGIAMIYDGMKNKGGQEKNRLWFGIAHVVFAMLVFAFLLYSMAA